MKEKSTKLFENYNETLLALASILWGFWLLVFVDWNALAFYTIYKHYFSVADLANFGLYIPKVSYNINIVPIKLFWGFPPILWGLVDLWAMMQNKIQVRKLIKAALCLYWLMIGFRLMTNNLNSPMLPLILFYFASYLLLYIRFDDGYRKL